MMKKFWVGVLAVVMGVGVLGSVGVVGAVDTVPANAENCNADSSVVPLDVKERSSCAAWCLSFGQSAGINTMWSSEGDGKCLNPSGEVVGGTGSGGSGGTGGGSGGGSVDTGSYKAICEQDGIDDEAKELAGCNLTSDDRLENVGRDVINAAIGVTAVLAIIAIILGGIQMALSTGDPGRANKAKVTIMFGAIAVVVATLAAVIVNFVITGLFGVVESGVSGWMDGFEAWWGLIWGGGV